MQKRFDTPYVILPEDNTSILYKQVNAELIAVEELPYASTSKFHLFGAKWLVVIDQNFNRIAVDLITDDRTQRHFELKAKGEECFHCARMVGETLYLGGNRETECLWHIDLSASQQQRIPCPMPEECTGQGKAVDDFVVFGDLLIAVDNVIFPKYFIKYDVSEPNTPNILKYIDMFAIPDEEVRQALECDGKFATLSYAFHRLGSLQSIQVYDKETMSISGNVYVERSEEHLGDKWRMIAYADGYILAACGISVGYIRLKDKKLKMRTITTGTLTKERLCETHEIVPLDETLIAIGPTSQGMQSWCRIEQWRKALR